MKDFLQDLIIAILLLLLIIFVVVGIGYGLMYLFQYLNCEAYSLILTGVVLGLFLLLLNAGKRH